ncbi:MAG TPA: OsmC family protein [bacterium]|nr:OsmC family protein [bacterium]
MRVDVQWTAPMRFAGRAASGAQTVMAARRAGEVPAGPSPMETVLMALCACAGIDVVEILAKMRVNLADLRIEADAERASEPPRVFTRIHLRFELRGAGLSVERAERAVRLSLDRYCSVAAMLRSTAQISHEVIVRPAEEIGEADGVRQAARPGASRARAAGSRRPPNRGPRPRR